MHKVGRSPRCGESTVPTEERALSGRSSPWATLQMDGFASFCCQHLVIIMILTASAIIASTY